MMLLTAVASINRLIIVLCLLASLLLSFLMLSAHANAASQVFSKTQLESIKRQNIGKQWLMVLWSVDCPACFKELALIEKMRQQQPDITVVIINADDNDDIQTEREQVLISYNLSALAHYHFSDGQGEQSRYLIDSSWYGELPRSYFVESNGRFHGKSGLINEQFAIKWLTQAPSFQAKSVQVNHVQINRPEPAESSD